MLRRLQRSASQPAGSENKRDESRGRQRNHLRIGPVEHHFEPDHDGGEDQQHEVIERMGEVEECDRTLPGAVW
jgi:hypothetical protein